MIVGLLRKKECEFLSFLDLFPIDTAPQAHRKGRCSKCPLDCHGHPIVFPCDGRMHGKWVGGTLLCIVDFKRHYMPKLKVRELA